MPLDRLSDRFESGPSNHSNLNGATNGSPERESRSGDPTSAIHQVAGVGDPYGMGALSSELLKRVSSMLAAADQVRLKSCCKALHDIPLNSNISIVDEPSLKQLAQEFVELFGLPLSSVIDDDPVEVARLLYRLPFFERYIDRHLEPSDKVTFKDKITYIMNGDRLSAFNFYHYHPTNIQLYAFQNPGTNPLSDDIEDHLRHIQHHLDHGNTIQAWLSANLAFSCCNKSFWKDLQANTYDIHTKAMMITVCLHSNNLIKLGWAFRALSTISRDAPSETLVTILHTKQLVEGLMKWLDVSKPAISHQTHKFINLLLEENENRVILGKQDFLLDYLSQQLKNTDYNVRVHSIFSLVFLVHHVGNHKKILTRKALLDNITHLLVSADEKEQCVAVKFFHILTSSIHHSSQIMSQTEFFNGLSRILEHSTGTHAYKNVIRVVDMINRFAQRSDIRPLLVNHRTLVKNLQRWAEHPNGRLSQFVQSVLALLKAYPASIVQSQDNDTGGKRRIVFKYVPGQDQFKKQRSAHKKSEGRQADLLDSDLLLPSTFSVETYASSLVDKLGFVLFNTEHNADSVVFSARLILERLNVNKRLSVDEIVSNGILSAEQLAQNFLDACAFPLTRQIHPDPIIATRIIYEDTHFERYLDQYLTPNDPVDALDKVQYMVHRKRIPYFSIENYHQTNINLAAFFSGSRRLESLSFDLNIIEAHLKEGREDLAWLRVNQATLDVWNHQSPLPIQEFLSYGSHDPATSVMLLSPWLSYSSKIYCELAAITIAKLYKVEDNRERLSNVRGLLDVVADAFCRTNDSEQYHLLKSLDFMSFSAFSRERIVNQSDLIEKLKAVITNLEETNPKYDKQMQQLAAGILIRLAKDVNCQSMLNRHPGLTESFNEAIPRFDAVNSDHSKSIAESLRNFLKQLQM